MRKGAKSRKEIPEEVLQKLNQGSIPSTNLVEWLAVDKPLLLRHLLAGLGRSAYLPPIMEQIDSLKKVTVNTLDETIGSGLRLQAFLQQDQELFPALAAHPSDTVRCWAAYFIGRNADISLAEALEKVKPFAADTHFGVREIAWMAIRPQLSLNLQEGVGILVFWAQDRDANIRRFAAEATRPRGVWCAHISILKSQPDLGLPLLELLRDDPSKYVQDSVGNWLNDASKTSPVFVRQLCERWATESDTVSTRYIIRRALRTLGKKGE